MKQITFSSLPFFNEHAHLFNIPPFESEEDMKNHIIANENFGIFVSLFVLFDKNIPNIEYVYEKQTEDLCIIFAKYKSDTFEKTLNRREFLWHVLSNKFH